MRELIILITLDPQNVYDSGVQPNQQYEGSSDEDEPHHNFSLGNPLLFIRPHVNAISFFLIKFLVQEIRDIENQRGDPNPRNNNLEKSIMVIGLSGVCNNTSD